MSRAALRVCLHVSLHAAVLAPLAATASAFAQESPNIASATAPSPGVHIPRAQARVTLFDGGQTLLAEDLRAEYGIARNLSAFAELPLYQGFLDAPRPSDGEFGLGALELGVEYRMLQQDLDAIDTVRGAMLAGAALPTATDGFGRQSFDPFVGAAINAIFGRHGLNAAARYSFVTGDTDLPLFIGDDGEDVIGADLGYVFRLAPAEYTEVREAAWYLTLELNTQWTAGGDREVLLSPGLLIEAPDYAIEAGVQLPLSQRENGRPEVDLGFFAGIRLIY